MLGRRQGQPIPAAAVNAPAGSYVLARIIAEGADPGMAVSVSCAARRGASASSASITSGPGARWSIRASSSGRSGTGTSSSSPSGRDSSTPTLGREREGGENLTPEERFRALSPSEQTTFDAITHALMNSSLTDDSGQPLGTAFDLVAGLDRIAGEQAGRGGDQQFRIYVTLRPNARDILDRSREFVRSQENTAYHAGYPHSYRLGWGAEHPVLHGRRRAQRGHRRRLSHEQGSPIVVQRPSHVVEFGRPGRRQRAAPHRRWNGFTNWWSERSVP